MPAPVCIRCGHTIPRHDPECDRFTVLRLRAQDGREYERINYRQRIAEEAKR